MSTGTAGALCLDCGETYNTDCGHTCKADGRSVARTYSKRELDMLERQKYLEEVVRRLASELEALKPGASFDRHCNLTVKIHSSIEAYDVRFIQGLEKSLDDALLAWGYSRVMKTVDDQITIGYYQIARAL